MSGPRPKKVSRRDAEVVQPRQHVVDSDRRRSTRSSATVASTVPPSTAGPRRDVLHYRRCTAARHLDRRARHCPARRARPRRQLHPDPRMPRWHDCIHAAQRVASEHHARAVGLDDPLHDHADASYFIEAKHPPVRACRLGIRGLAHLEKFTLRQHDVSCRTLTRSSHARRRTRLLRIFTDRRETDRARPCQSVELHLQFVERFGLPHENTLRHERRRDAKPGRTGSPAPSERASDVAFTTRCPWSRIASASVAGAHRHSPPSSTTPLSPFTRARAPSANVSFVAASMPTTAGMPFTARDDGRRVRADHRDR